MKFTEEKLEYLLHTKNTGNCKGSSLKLQNKIPWFPLC
jgi:hypothetical protein